MDTLVARMREQSEQCAAAGSRLTAALLHGAADDLGAGGPVADLLGPHEADPAGSVPSLRLAGALHRLVLERRAPLLATHYPSVGGTAPVEGVWEAARVVVADQLEALRPLVRRPVQTNETGRAAALWGGLQLLGGDGLPVALLEIGASAGLNLLADRFAYRVAGVVRGHAASPVRLEEPWAGALPRDVPVRVLERAGCDPSPLDPSTPDGRLTLTSYVWADQLPRLERLRGALALAGHSPVPVVDAPASVFLDEQLARPRPGRRTVVWHSVVRQYLSPAEAAAFDRLLRAAGERATAQAPLAHLSLEPERVGDARFTFRVTVRTWPGGEVRVLADAQGHGPPVVWR